MRAVRFSLSAIRCAAMISLLAIVQVSHAAAEDTLRVAYWDAYPPYSVGKNEAVGGLFIDVLNEALGTRMKLKITHTGLPWARAQSLVASGEADALVTLATPERLKTLAESKTPVYTAEMRFYVGAQHPQLDALKKVTTIEAAKPYTIGNFIGSGWVASHMPGYRVDSTATLEQTFKKVAASRVDLVPAVSDQAQSIIKELGLEKDVVELPGVIDSLPYKVLIRQTSPFSKLLPQIDTTLQAMREDGSMEKIYNRYGKTLRK